MLWNWQICFVWNDISWHCVNSISANMFVCYHVSYFLLIYWWCLSILFSVIQCGFTCINCEIWNTINNTIWNTTNDLKSKVLWHYQTELPWSRTTWILELCNPIDVSCACQTETDVTQHSQRLLALFVCLRSSAMIICRAFWDFIDQCCIRSW